MLTKQYYMSIDLANKAKEAVSRFGVLRLTGHSLGGGLATAGSLTSDTSAVVFNPAGVSRRTLRGYTANWANAENLITRYVVAGDPLDIVNSVWGTPDSVGRRVNLLPNTFSFNPIYLHSMDSVLNTR